MKIQRFFPSKFDLNYFVGNFFLLSFFVITTFSSLQAQTNKTYFYAIEDLSIGEAIRRGQTESNGIPDGGVILPPNTKFRHWVVEGPTLRIGFSEFTTPQSGQRFRIPAAGLRLTLTDDRDLDGLSDEIEFVLGTNVANDDTDNDGIEDGEEVRQGTDPNDTFVAQTGLISSVDTEGLAVDVAAFNNLVILANAGEGISVFNVFNRMAPTIVADVDTPGRAQAVAFGGGTRILVADGPTGAVVIDISDPPNSHILTTNFLGSEATSATVSGPLGFVGTSTGEVAVIDLDSGVRLSRNFVFSEAVEDLVWSGSRLYAATKTSLAVLELDGLRVVPVGRGSLRPYASFVGDIERFRLSVGNGIVYYPFINGGQAGYQILDASNPGNREIAAHVSPALGWKQFIPDGSGRALAAVGPNPEYQSSDNIGLYDISDLGDLSTTFQGEFPTPAAAYAVTLFNGLGYVADGERGLHVLNFTSPDFAGQAPTVDLASNSTDGTIEEGQTLRLFATTSDDVQVRNVEFLLDGRILATDGNFSFEYALPAPALAGRDNVELTITARVSDIGGNRTLSDPITLRLTRDNTSPGIVASIPPNGGAIGQTTSLSITLTEALDPGTLAGGVRLFGAGTDGIIGNADDTTITTFTPSVPSGTTSLVLTLAELLQPGIYAIRLSNLLADQFGNSLRATDLTFTVFDGLDTDGDGIRDETENLIAGLDPLVPDSDRNGVLDGNEDTDGDGLLNSFEDLNRLNLASNDSDNDTIPDADENEDFDALNNLQEQQFGTRTDSRDTDQDGWSDDGEAFSGSNPLLASSVPRFISLSPSARTVTTIYRPSRTFEAGPRIRTTVLTADPGGFRSTGSKPKLKVRITE